ncbi:MAG TPA: hypothetical protein VM511_02275 [Luteolibacter sp.]|nr:hypothetical protein [Luteolibacter sp.]
MKFPARNHPPPSSIALHCPFCDGALKPGALELEYTFWGTLLAGFSHLVLMFRAPGEKHLILEPSSSRESFMCPTCSTLVTPGPSIRLPRQPIQ